MMETVQPNPSSSGTQQSRPLTSQEAVQGVRNALAVANPSFESQLAVYRALRTAARTLQNDSTEAELADVLEELMVSRGKLLYTVIEETIKRAEAAHQQHAAKTPLVHALRAAIEVCAEINPDDPQLSTMQQRLQELQGRSAGGAPKVRPFFARFLEHQNRQHIVTAPERGDREPEEVLVTLKSPSDHEDRGTDDLGGDIVVTLKAPSDHEDRGLEGHPVTLKFPSDAEDYGIDGIAVTLKAPSDHEDQSGSTEPSVFVTLKFPSDHDEEVPYAGQYADSQTEKFPSDAEDHGMDTLLEIPVTLKAPSDHEDGGTGGREDLVVTLKAPSDHEDAGITSPAPMTRKFPSDAEDTGPGDGGVVTRKFPSDAEDGGIHGPDDTYGNPVTLKFPSDAEDGGPSDGGFITLKFPSDAEDGGDFDPGQVVTAKFPSDHEDGGARLRDIVAVTLKFPSDNDEGSHPGGSGSNMMTAKFPSDDDENLTIDA